MRATDELVVHWLTWARNYEEIVGFTKVANRGRKWEIRLPALATMSGATPGSLTAQREEYIAPLVFVLTNREAVAFGYGLAVAGNREARREFAKREWDW